MSRATMRDAAATLDPTTADHDAALYVLEGVERTFARAGTTVRALYGIDLTIARGEFVALEGPSGSGKTSLLSLLGALEVPSAGSLRFEGLELSALADRVRTSIRSREIGFVFQHFNLIATLSATENVAVALRDGGHRARLRHAAELLERVGLGHRLGHLPSRMSGGEQQRVAIARALANSPRVIIADEPTGNLDSATAHEVIDLIGALNAADGVTVIIATHDHDIAAAVHRRIQLRDGAIAADVQV